jgi:heme/copper-type cytochrome/quinol oxidase subunit 2
MGQNIMIGVMFDPSHAKDISNVPGSENIPTFFKFMLSNIRLFFLSILIVSSTTLISSIALLKRKNWGRLIFIFILALGIAWVVFGVTMQFTIFPKMMHDVPDFNGSERFKFMFTFMRIFIAVFAAAFCGLFAWIIKKLSSQPIKSEFLS